MFKCIVIPLAVTVTVVIMLSGSILGNFHQGCIPGLPAMSGGSQCTAIAVVALLFVAFDLHGRTNDNSQSMPVSLHSLYPWESTVVDHVILEGDRLYSDIIENNFPDNPFHLLSYEDVPSELHVLGQEYLYLPVGTFVYGCVSSQYIDNVESGGVSLQSALNSMFENSNYGLLTIGSSTFALWCESDHFYMFDSHARNMLGEVDGNGAAVVLQFSELNSLVNHAEINYNGHIFNVVAIAFGKKPTNCTQTMEMDINDSSTIVSNSSTSGLMPPTVSNEHMRSPRVLDTTGEFPVPLVSAVSDITLHHGRTRSDWLCRSASWLDHSYALFGKDTLNNRKRRGKYRLTSTTMDSVSLGDLSSVLRDDLLQENSLILMDTYPPLGAIETVCTSTFACIAPALSKEEEQVEAMYNKYIQETPCHVCFSCLKFLFADKIYHIKHQALDVCDELGITQSHDLCHFCFSKLSINKYPCINAAYNSLDPGIIPPVLVGLTRMEKRMISKIHVFMTVVVLPGGQFAEKGMAIDFPVDVHENINVLPRNSANCNVITLSYNGSSEQIAIDSVVRTEAAVSALTWLIENNACYENVTIDLDSFDYSECGGLDDSMASIYRK